MIHDYKYIESLWGTIDPNEPLNIYINIPFCYCNCRYCLYKGTTDITQENKTKFVFDYLIPNIKRFKNILDSHQITSVYFGGGTPNAITTSDIKSIIDILGNVFSKAHCKIIEINPAFVDDYYIRELCDLDFTLITFGAQSFDQSALSFQKRPYVSADMIYYLGSTLHKHNIRFSIDLMCYLKNYTVQDLDFFQQDIEYAQKTEADFITFYPELNLILHDTKARNNFINFIENYSFKGYYLDKTLSSKTDNQRSIYRILRNDLELNMFTKHILPYYENDFPYAIQNIIGFGDNHNGQEVVSYSPNKFFYLEKNINNIPFYDVRYNWRANHEY